MFHSYLPVKVADICSVFLGRTPVTVNLRYSLQLLSGALHIMRDIGIKDYVELLSLFPFSKLDSVS